MTRPISTCACSLLLLALTFAAFGDEEPSGQVTGSDTASKSRPVVKGGRPVSVVVLDGKTKKPVTSFTYRYRIDAPGIEQHGLDRLSPLHKVSSADGTFTIPAPRSCRVVLSIFAEGFCRYHTYPGRLKHNIHPTDVKRRIEIHLDPGHTVRGTILDAKTATPIIGARVRGMVSTPPGASPDLDYSVPTDSKGRFELRGVDTLWGIHVSHADYLSTKIRRNELKAGPGEDIWTAKVKLKQGKTVHGVVHDADGTLLAGVKIYKPAITVAFERPEYTTNAKGAFTAKGLPAGYAHLWFDKAGFDSKDDSVPMTNRRWVVVMRRPLEIGGRVLDDNGQPVRTCIVRAGPVQDWGISAGLEQKVNDAAGRFRFKVPDAWGSQAIWLGVRSPGFAPYQQSVSMKSIGNHTVRLSRGVAVSGTLRGAAFGNRDVRVRIFPSTKPNADGPESLDYPPIAIATQIAAVAQDGTFRLGHVSPGKYELNVLGKGITPVVKTVVVTDKGLDVGVISVKGTGRVEGLVGKTKDMKRAFARGYIVMTELALPRESLFSPSPYPTAIHFITDSMGRFKVDGIPVGKAFVEFSYHMSADIVGRLAAGIEVKEGLTTKVTVSE